MPNDWHIETIKGARIKVLRNDQLTKILTSPSTKVRRGVRWKFIAEVTALVGGTSICTLLLATGVGPPWAQPWLAMALLIIPWLVAIVFWPRGGVRIK